jgi:hypothetical protein
MKIILGVFCALMVLFAGGCALLLVSGAGYNGMFQSLPFAAIPGAIAALNVLVLVALFGRARPNAWAFHTLAILDLVAVAVLALMWSGVGLKDSEINVIGIILIGGLAVKALLTFIAARRV